MAQRLACIAKTIPDVVFHTRVNNQWKDVSTNDIFSNKKVVVFSLPGAFTPTCSTSHLPRYEELAPTFFANGVDDIYCMSVNDTFVMNAWGVDQKLKHVKLIPDGNGELTNALGLLVDKKFLGFGHRSWRFSMFVDNKEIKQVFIEPEKEGDPFEVSDADTMLKHIAPKAVAPKNVTIFTRHGCPFCQQAKDLLASKNLLFEEIPLSNDVTTRTLRAVCGQTTVPQVFVGGQHVGGAEDLAKFLA